MFKPWRDEASRNGTRRQAIEAIGIVIFLCASAADCAKSRLTSRGDASEGRAEALESAPPSSTDTASEAASSSLLDGEVIEPSPIDTSSWSPPPDAESVETATAREVPDDQGGHFGGPFPSCTVKERQGQCMAGDQNSLNTVTLRLGAIVSGDGGTAVRPGDDAVLVINASTTASYAPADRIGLLAPQSGNQVTIRFNRGLDGGPCSIVSDFGIAKNLLGSASFGIAFSPTLTSGARIHFVAWATPWTSDCISQPMEFDIVLD